MRILSGLKGDIRLSAGDNDIGDEKNQEICNQLNRRTEFIVLRTTYGMAVTPASAPSDAPAQAEPNK